MLTETQIRNAQPGPSSYKLTDAQGLYLEIKPNGVKAWRYRFFMTRGERRFESVFTLGVHATQKKDETTEQTAARQAADLLTLEEARIRLIGARALVKKGINPADQRKTEKILINQGNAITFEAVAKEWLAMKDWEDSTKSRTRSMLERAIYPKIGRLPLRQITAPHALEVLQSTHKNNGPSVAAAARRAMTGVFELAMATLRADNDPTYLVRKALPPNKTQHKRAMEVEEVGELLNDINRLKGRHETFLAFRLMWWTLCRPIEVTGAQWSEFDFERGLWTIPACRMKMRRPHIVPLPTQALEALRAFQAITGEDPYVLPGRDRQEGGMSTAALRQALHVLGWSTRYSPHATRTTGSTRLHEMGYNTDWIERQLAHAEPNVVRRTYNQALYLDGRREMMQQWADCLDEWEARAKKKAKPTRKHASMTAITNVSSGKDNLRIKGRLAQGRLAQQEVAACG